MKLIEISQLIDANNVEIDSQRYNNILLANAEAFLRAGGNLSLTDWQLLNNVERKAFIDANNLLKIENICCTVQAIQNEHILDQLTAQYDDGNYLIEKVLNRSIINIKKTMEGQKIE